MKRFIITGTSIVERTFEVVADSEAAAREHPETWEEVEEITQERLSLDIEADDESEAQS